MTGGPKRMGPDELHELLSTSRWGSFCAEDRAGDLQARPIWIKAATDDQLTLVAPAGWDGVTEGAAGCVVVDEFKTYLGIRGAILRGFLRSHHPPDMAGRADRGFTITTSHGFTFEGSSTSL